jgi:hypothetical protein
VGAVVVEAQGQDPEAENRAVDPDYPEGANRRREADFR